MSIGTLKTKPKRKQQHGKAPRESKTLPRGKHSCSVDILIGLLSRHGATSVPTKVADSIGSLPPPSIIQSLPNNEPPCRSALFDNLRVPALVAQESAETDFGSLMSGFFDLFLKTHAPQAIRP